MNIQCGILSSCNQTALWHSKRLTFKALCHSATHNLRGSHGSVIFDMVIEDFVSGYQCDLMVYIRMDLRAKQECVMSDSAFQRALDEYFKTVPSRKRKSKFILACYNSSVPVTPDSVNDAMQKAEEKLSQRGSRKLLTKVMAPLISSLKNYFGIVDTLSK